MFSASIPPNSPQPTQATSQEKKSQSAKQPANKETKNLPYNQGTTHSYQTRPNQRSYKPKQIANQNASQPSSRPKNRPKIYPTAHSGRPSINQPSLINYPTTEEISLFFDGVGGQCHAVPDSHEEHFLPRGEKVG